MGTFISPVDPRDPEVIGGPIEGIAPDFTGTTQVGYPTTSAVESGGWVNPSLAHADDGAYATAAPARNNVLSERWGNFGFDGTIPVGATITNVKVQYEFRVNTTASIATMRMRARVGGVNLANHDDATEPTTDKVVIVDVTADKAWTRDDLLNANFQITMEARRGNSNQAVSFFLDYIYVEVTYDTTTTLLPLAITSGEAFGTASLQQQVAVSGIASAEAFGSHLVTTPTTFIIGAGAIATGEAIGSHSLQQNVSVSGIATAEAFGTPNVTAGFQITNTGIASAEAFGTPVIQHNVAPTGIASAEAFGVATMQLHLLPTGIASGEFVQAGVVIFSTTSILEAGAIASAETFGTTAIQVDVAPAAIASAEAFGIPTVVGTVSISPSSIASAEAFGVAALQQSLTVNAIASDETFGFPSVLDVSDQTITCTGIDTGEFWGTATLNLAGIVETSAYRHGGVASVNPRYKGRSPASLEAEFRQMERS